MPPSYDDRPSSELYRDAEQVRRFRDSLTAEQKTIAYYWADNAGETGTPVGHWLSIASQMAAARGMSAPASYERFHD